MNNEQPLISIIVSTLNDGDKLISTINSISSQDYKFKELIIIDGNSSDTTKDILKKNKQKIDFYISENDEGIYDAWNKGISNSNGKWISFLGAGDRYYQEDSLSSLLRCVSDPETNFVSGIIYLENKNNEQIGSLGKKWNKDNLKNNINIGHPGSLHHISLFNQYGRFNKNYKICGDYEFLIRASKTIVANFCPHYIVKMDNLGISNQRPFLAIYESAKAMYFSRDFGVYLSIRYTLLSLTKTIIKFILLKFPYGETLIKKMKREKIDK
tara:strand:+ start:461 stop:1267 length:807 start_codon:yes stop_codon:yes gene_type:complete